MSGQSNNKGQRYQKEFIMTGDWTKFLRHHFPRDLSFIIGGTSLLLCFNYSWPNTKSVIFGTDIILPEYLFIASVAYVLGYLVQELSCVVFGKLVTTSAKKTIPSKWVKGAYERYTQTKVVWEQIPDYDEDDATIYINLKKSERNQAEFERMIVHLIMCITIGMCWIIVGSILIIHFVYEIIKFRFKCGHFYISNWNELIFSLVILMVGGCLVFLGKIKSLRIQKFRHDLIKDLKHVIGSLRQSQQALKESQETKPKGE